MARPILLLTRPEPQSRRLADEVRARFGELETVISPLMQTVFTGGAMPDGTGVIFTSETAVAAYCRVSDRRDLTAWCVGPRTAQAAAQAGFATRIGPGTAPDLLQMILVENPAGPLLWPRGEHVAFDIGEALSSAGIETIQAVLYRQDPCPMTDHAKRALAGDDPVLVPVFSPRSAGLLIPWLSGRTAPLYVAAISRNVADALASAAPDCLRISATPDGEGMLTALGELIAESSTP